MTIFVYLILIVAHLIMETHLDLYIRIKMKALIVKDCHLYSIISAIHYL